MSRHPDPDPTSARRPSGPPPFARSRCLRVVIEDGPGDQLVIKTGTNPAAIVAVEREALVLSQIRHPNIVDLLRTERGDRDASLVTQFAGHITLDDLHPADAADVARLGASLLTVVGDLHTMGWSHGRIRADHCIVGTNGRLTLCAFGAAHRAEPRDPRRSADLAATIAVIATLADRLEAPSDRAARRRTRTLRGLLADTASGPATPEAAERLRSELTRLSGAVAVSAVADQTITRPTRTRTTSDSESTTRSTAEQRPSRARGFAASGSALVALLGTVAFLRWVGGPIGASSTHGVQRFGDIPEPVLLAFTIIRVVAFAACTYGIVLAAALFAAVLTRRPDIERLATAMAPPRLRRFLIGLIGVGMLSSLATGPSATGPNHPPTPTASSPTTPSSTVSTSTVSTSTSEPAATTSTSVTTTSTPSAAPSSSVPSAIVPTDPAVPLTDVAGPVDPGTSIASPDDGTVAPVSPSQLPNMWVIHPGDHLWGVATAALEAHLGRTVSDGEIDAYWRRLVEMNRGSLVDRDNPDLVYAGQVIELPEFE